MILNDLPYVLINRMGWVTEKCQDQLKRSFMAELLYLREITGQEGLSILYPMYLYVSLEEDYFTRLFVRSTYHDHREVRDHRGMVTALVAGRLVLSYPDLLNFNCSKSKHPILHYSETVGLKLLVASWLDPAKGSSSWVQNTQLKHRWPSEYEDGFARCREWKTLLFGEDEPDNFIPSDWIRNPTPIDVFRKLQDYWPSHASLTEPELEPKLPRRRRAIKTR